jgi:hypothetical protein
MLWLLARLVPIRVLWTNRRYFKHHCEVWVILGGKTLIFLPVSGREVEGVYCDRA